MRWIACGLVVLGTGTAWAGSSNSLMDVSPDGTKLLVACNQDETGEIVVVDTATRKVVFRQKCPKSEGVSWVGNGPTALVAHYFKDKITIADTSDASKSATLDVPDEPYGVVTSRDGKRAWVTHDYLGSVSEIDVEARKVVRTVPAGQFVRGIALSPDETRLYVTEFFSGKLIAVGVTDGKVVDQWPGHPEDNLCRSVVLHPTRPKAYLTHLRSRVHVVNSRGSIFPHLSICTTSADAATRRTMVRLDTYNGVYVVANPWESAISPDGKKLYTVYAATDDMNVSEIVDDDYREMRRSGGTPIQVGKNPRAVRVSPDGKSVYVLNNLDYAVMAFDAATMRKPETIVLTDAPAITTSMLRGEMLFNSTKTPMTGDRWVACSSCHPQGGHDGRVWQNGEGSRRSTGFAGLRHTHPLHWSADRDEVQDFEYTIRGNLMGGRGLFNGAVKPKGGFTPTELDMHFAGKSADLDALAEYCNKFPVTPSPHAAGKGKLTEQAERGKAVFFSAETKCATCHSGPYYTDSRLEKPYNLHDVGTGDSPTEKMGPRYDTPTLLGVYRLTSYLHDGRAKTLRDVLTAHNAGDRHGKTSHLSPAQIDDLVAFLKSLPYDDLPDETPNTLSRPKSGGRRRGRSIECAARFRRP